MASDSTDSAFGFILFILFLALLGYAAGGISPSSSTTGTTGGTSQSLPPLAGSSVPSCMGMGTPKKDETKSQTLSSTMYSLNLKVYVDPMDRGRKCATATVMVGTATPSATTKVTLAYTYDPTQMVSSTGDQTASVQVTGTDNFCVSAVAVADISGIRITLPITTVDDSCQTTVQTVSPVTVPPVTDKEDREDGY
jgi:hypothetical protein